MLRTGKEIRFRFWLSEDKAGKEAKRRPTVGSLSFAEAASRSRSQPKMEDNLFTSPKGCYTIEGYSMDEMDCRILKALQNDFPLSERPYEIIARRLQIPCEELWNRVQRLIAEGVIRRIGASLDSRKLGFCSTLAAVSCKADLVEQAAKIIGQFPEVTHSYLRNDNFNIWFTIIAVDEERIEYILEHIRTSLSLESSQVLNLPMKHLFKLNARFNVAL